MKPDYKFERAIAQDDYLDRRLAHWAAAEGDRIGRCEILFHFEEQCDQCARKTYRSHIAAGRSFCKSCCPACAAAR